jgi:tRNA dimethylallyltransferase
MARKKLWSTTMATLLEHTEGPLVVIVGPTASGKTGLGIELAEELGGEIICADSRTIYKGMDIGTAKPTAAEQARVPHWGLDLVEPGESFSAASFKEYAVKKIQAIRARGRIPFLVGGSGLYIDAVLFDYQFGSKADADRRQQLEAMDIRQLHEYCKKNDITLPENTYNKRYVIRAIERQGLPVKRQMTPKTSSIIVGIATDIEVLRTRIADRSEQLFTNGVVEEAMILGKKYGWQSEAMTGNIYPLVRAYSAGEMRLNEVIATFEMLDRKLAKRQMTWFRRNPYIVWVTREEATDYIRKRLTLDAW